MNISIYKKTGLFYGLSTVIPWTLWFTAGYISHIDTAGTTLQILTSVLAFMGLVAPVVITLFLVRGNPMLINDLRNRIFNFKSIDSTYIILAIVLMPFSILMAQTVSLLFGYSMEQFKLADSFSFSSGIFPVWFLMIIAPLLEELAWHSYGTDALRSRYSLLKTSALFGLFWGLWHIPLTGINNYYHNNLVEEGWIYALNFIVSHFPFVLIMNWIYYKANRNIVLPVLFHMAAVFFNEIFDTHPMSKVIQTCLLIVFAIYIVLNDKAFFFSKELKTEIIKNKSFRIDYHTRIGIILFILCIFFAGSPKDLSAREAPQPDSGQMFDDMTDESIPLAAVLKDPGPRSGQITRPVFIGLQPNITVEPFYEEGEFDVNVFPFIFESSIGERLNIKLSPLVNYHFGGVSNGVSDIGLFTVFPIFLKAKENSEDKPYGFYIGPVLGFGRNLMNDHYTTTLAVEPGYMFEAKKRFTISLGLQVGGSYFSYDTEPNEWILHWGPKVSFGFWIN